MAAAGCVCSVEWGCHMFVQRFRTWSAGANCDQRADAIAELAKTWLDDRIDDEDRRSTEQVFTLYLDDPNPNVRVALAEAIASHDHAPRKLIWALMQDIPEVSAVVFRQSPLLRAADLFHAIEDGDAAVQVAIAERGDLGADLVRALVKSCAAEAAVVLLENPTVKLSPSLKHDLALRLQDDAELRGALLSDHDILPNTRHLLVSSVSSALLAFNNRQGWMDADRLRIAALDASGKAAVEIAGSTPFGDMIHYAGHLRKAGQLTPALLVRAICSGNATLFEAGIALLSGTSLSRVQSIIEAGRLSAFKSLYTKTRLPKSTYPVFAAAISVWQKPGSEADVLSEIISAVEDSPELDGATLALLGRMACEADRKAVMNNDRQLLLTAA